MDLEGDLSPPDSLETDLDPAVVGPAYLQTLRETRTHFTSGTWDRCLTLCDLLLDITWEHLNSGHWKDVHITWRHAYTALSWLKALSLYARGSLQDAVQTCDMGLLMGAPIHNNILSRLVSFLQKNYTASVTSKRTTEAENSPTAKKLRPGSKVPDINPAMAVPLLDLPSLEHFRGRFKETATPVIIAKSMDYWPALSSRRWSLDYLRKVAGCRTVPIELGSKYTEDEWSQSLITINEFIDKYVANVTGEKGYLAQHQLFEQIPELRRDIDIPTYCALGDSDDVDINAWFGPEGTVSPLHHDPKHNFLCQVVGSKYIRLYDHSADVYPHDTTLFSNTSQVDVENPDLEKFPDFAETPYTECILREGEMLYIPPKHWHYVRSLSVSFSVSFWWE